MIYNERASLLLLVLGIPLSLFMLGLLVGIYYEDKDRDGK